MPAPAPAIDPNQRHPDDIANASTYRPNDRVWAWAPLDRQWRAGIVDACSNRAVLVTFQLSGGGTGVDSLLPQYVMPRIERDEEFDRAVTDPFLPSRPRDVHAADTGSAAPGDLSLPHLQTPEET